MDIIFDLAGGASSPPLAVGTMTRPLEVQRGGRQSLLGVRFRPGGATPFMPGEAHVLTDTATALHDLWGAGAAETGERLFDGGGTTGRLSVLDDVLRRRLERRRPAVDEAVLHAAELATRSRGTASVHAMAKAAGLGRRQLERRFLDAVGIPPKVVARVLRFRHAVTLLHTRPGDGLSRVAFAAGYADQSHFSREFRALAHTTPGRYRTARLPS